MIFHMTLSPLMGPLLSSDWTVVYGRWDTCGRLRRPLGPTTFQLCADCSVVMLLSSFQTLPETRIPSYAGSLHLKKTLVPALYRVIQDPNNEVTHTCTHPHMHTFLHTFLHMHTHAHTSTCTVGSGQRFVIEGISRSPLWYFHQH